MHLSRLGLLVHLVASLPWWHPSTSALPWHGSILGVLMHLAGAARTSAMGVAGIGVHLWWRLLAGCACRSGWRLTKVAAGAYVGITRVCSKPSDVVAGLISSDGGCAGPPPSMPRRLWATPDRSIAMVAMPGLALMVSLLLF